MLVDSMERNIPKTIFFWTLVVLFFVTASSIIGYAFGYRFNLSKGVFVYAGSITLKATPSTVDVYIDGVLIPNKKLSLLNGSYHIGGIAPGNYQLEVRAAGYQTWSKSIAVHSGISTEFWNIVLAKNSYSRDDYDTPGIEKFFISPRKNQAAFSQQIGDTFFVKIFDPATLGIKEVFSASDHVFTDNAKENIEWMPKGTRIIIPTLSNTDRVKDYFIVTVDTNETLNLKDIAGADDLSHVRWDPKTENALFYMSGDSLYRVDLDSPESKKLIAEHISGYDLTPKGLFYFQLPEGIIYETNLEGTDSPAQITTSAPDNMSDASYQIIVYDQDRITLLNASHDLYVYNKAETGTYFHELSDSALGSQFSDDGKKLLFWNDHEISAYFTRKWEVPPQRSENEDMSITRFSDPIKNVQWTRDYEHALFTVDKKIKIIELDNRDKRNMMDVLMLNDDSTLLVSNFADGKLYYTEKNDQGQNILHSIIFPDQVSLLGKLQGQ